MCAGKAQDFPSPPERKFSQVFPSRWAFIKKGRLFRRWIFLEVLFHTRLTKERALEP